MKRRLPLIIFAVIAVSFYLGSYLYFRFTDTFIHRAGKYDFVDHFGEHHNGRHFIEPGRPEGGVLFAAVVANLDKTTPDEELKESMGAELQDLARASENAYRSRKRLFMVYRPLALIESLCWHFIDPDPPASRFSD